MRYQFKQSVSIQKKDYRVGVHEVSENVEYDPTFIKYVEKGLIVEAESQKVISTESAKEKAEKLHETLVKRRDAKKAAGKPKAPVAPSKATDPATAAMPPGAPESTITPAKEDEDAGEKAGKHGHAGKHGKSR